MLGVGSIASFRAILILTFLKGRNNENDTLIHAVQLLWYHVLPSTCKLQGDVTGTQTTL